MSSKEKSYRQPLFRRRELCFRCTQCGVCCSGNADYHVYIDERQAENIRLFMGLSRNWFRRRYLARKDDDLVLQSRDDGRCFLLDRNNHCRAYPVRPVQCATYPFWPELLKTSRAWRQEKSRCEGIDQGEPVPVAVIEAALSRCLDEEGE